MLLPRAAFLVLRLSPCLLPQLSVKNLIIHLLAELKRKEVHGSLAAEAEVQRLHAICHTERRGDVRHVLSGFDRDACRQRRELWRIADLRGIPR